MKDVLLTERVRAVKAADRLRKVRTVCQFLQGRLAETLSLAALVEWR